MEELKRRFQDPPAAYRGKPFWSWNGELEEQELLRQIGIFEQMGMGGYFCHSRTGLITEYLGEEWFSLINACADEGEKRGMETWLYDEDRWPSGTAGGMVTADARYRLKFLRLTRVDAKAYVPADRMIAAFESDLEGMAFTRSRRLAPGEKAAAGTVLVFTVEELQPSSFYNGCTYVDTMSREAIQEFIRRTHEQYAAHCGERLGSSIRGIFTDEPHRGAVMSGFSVPNPDPVWLTPYTPALFTEFRAAFGYELTDHLPELFLHKDGEKLSPVKWQYMELLQRLFIRNYLQPQQSWCREHNMQLTGHLLHEDSLTAQVAMAGSLMRCYGYMDLPGIDILAENGDLAVVPKQIQSAARQNGQKNILSEMYGATGWQMNFQSHKAVGDWQALFGVNLRCHHLAWYSMQGEAKRDYPASIHGQSAWYRQYRYVEDYYARIHLLMEQGQPLCDVLVINPVESLWAGIYPGWADGLTAADPAVGAVEEGYRTVFGSLCAAKADFDFGDEDMLARLGAVESGPDGERLRIGKMTYRTVVVPKMLTMRASTLEWLKAFGEQGGEVWFTAGRPEYVDAQRSAQANTIPGLDRELADVETALIARAPVTITGESGDLLRQVYAQVRQTENGWIVMLLNMDRRQSCRAVLHFRRGGRLDRWDPRTGAVEAVASGTEEVGLTLPLAAGEEALFTLTDASAHAGAPAAAAQATQPVCTAVHTLPEAFSYTLEEPNVCVLDIADLSVNGGEWRRDLEILKADQAVRRHFGLPLRGGEMLQPWFVRKYGQTGAAAPVCGEVTLRFRFYVDEVPKGVRLAVETPDRFAIRLNGSALPTVETDAFWVDACFKLIPVPDTLLRAGENELTLQAAFTPDLNLEAAYLLGDFGVRLSGLEKHLTALPSVLRAGDTVPQGLPFYGAGIGYRLTLPQPAPGNRLVLRFPECPLDAACVEITDGRDTRMVAFAPYAADVTAMAGREVQLRYILTRRNTFGPLHVYPERQGYYDPGLFVTEGVNFLADRYGLLAQGMTGTPICEEIGHEHV